MISLRNSTPRYREAGKTIRPSVTWPARSAARASFGFGALYQPCSSLGFAPGRGDTPPFHFRSCR